MPSESASSNSYQIGGTHYQTPIQHWDFVLANEIPYLEAQVIKYLVRWRKKNGLQDVYKARHFLEKLIEVEEAKIEVLVEKEDHREASENGSEVVSKANEYQQQSLRTECSQERAQQVLARGGVSLTRLLHSVIGMLGELGEVASLLENQVWYGGVPNGQKLIDEFGDVLWYLSQGVTAVGADLGSVMEANLAKLRVRYPERYEDSLAKRQNRDRAAEAEVQIAPEPVNLKKRTVEEVLSARVSNDGCCGRFRRVQQCGCLEEARRYAESSK